MGMELLGWVGALMVIAAYALISMQKITASGFSYQGMNVVGALLLAVYTWQKGAIPSSFLNIVWCVIGMVAIVAAIRARRKEGA